MISSGMGGGRSRPTNPCRFAAGDLRAVPGLGAAGLDKAGFVGENDGLRAVVEVKFEEDACDVRLDGGVADDEFAGDVGV